jgi:hypothetical protein
MLAMLLVRSMEQQVEQVSLKPSRACYADRYTKYRVSVLKSKCSTLVKSLFLDQSEKFRFKYTVFAQHVVYTKFS